MNYNKKLTFLDVFSGCGGLSLGLFSADMQGLFAIEKNDDAFSTLKYNLLNPKSTRYIFDWPKWLEKRAMEVADLLLKHNDKLTALRNKVDLIAGGPPCQGFSIAGKRDPNDPRNSLTEDYLQIVQIVQPRFLLIENVRGFNCAFNTKNRINRKAKAYSQLVQEKLEESGYTVFSDVICCSKFGIPQNRKRFIMLAIKNNDPVFQILEGKNPIELLLDNAQAFRVQKGLHANTNVSTKEAISDLETSKHPLIQHIGRYKCFKQIKYEQPDNLSAFQKLMRANVERKTPNSLRLARHTAPVTKRFMKIQALGTLGKCLSPADRKALGIKKHSITPLHPDMPSPTVTTLPDDILHYSEPRILTVRENARLQSFPDWFEFQGRYTTGGKKRKNECPRYTQVGNAVPPLLAEAIGLLLNQLVKKANAKSYENENKNQHSTPTSVKV